ncbi:MAG: response regulator [Deltaproteobacteria bacterium]|nr:response regulator [Deltaproteobacteria bacterium]
MPQPLFAAWRAHSRRGSSTGKISWPLGIARAYRQRGLPPGKEGLPPQAVRVGEATLDRKLLIVDDERAIRDLFQSALSEAGYEVYLAEEGQQALEILRQQRIDLIFLDLKLFGMNGIDLCRQIKKNHPLSVVYAITGWSGLFEVEECREAGFDDYFTKPIPLELLLKAVEEAFAKLRRWKSPFPPL